MIQVFKTDEDYKKWLDGQRLPSGIVVYVSDDETMYFTTNNIKGELKTYKCEKEEPIQYPPLIYSTNAAGSTITVNGETVTLGQGDNMVLEYPTAITSVKATSNTALTAIQIPNTVTSIESTAFNSCPYLASVNIPDSVTSIGDSAFQGCAALTDFNFNGTMSQWRAITLGTNWKNNAAFTVVHCTDGDVSLEEVIQYPPLVYSAKSAGSTITVNGETVTLEQGDNITLDYPNEITSVEATNNTVLTYIQIPNTVTSIEDGAFDNCSALASINIPDGVTSIGNNAFHLCGKLSDFNYNGTMSQWASITLGSGWCSFSLMVVHCSDGYVLTKYGIPTNKVNFSTNAAGSTITVNGQSVTLDKCNNCVLSYANEITSINATNNTALMMIKLPNTITSIDNNSFANCISLSFIIISDSITSINENAFYGCTTLNDFIYSGTKAQWASITKGTNWNKDTAFTVVHCTDGDVTL